MLQRLEVDPEDAGEPEAGVSRPCSLSVPHLEQCTAVCGRPGTGEQLYVLPGTVRLQGAQGGLALKSIDAREELVSVRKSRSTQGRD